MSAPVAVAIVSWNTRDLLDDCLRSLEPDAQAGLADVWVVDNASTDGSAELVRRSHAWATLIESTENVGFGEAVNRVARQSSSQWLAPANADIRLEPGALEALLDAGDRQPHAGIIAPQLILDDGSTQHSVYPFPTLWFTLLFNLGIASANKRLADHYTLQGHWDHTRGRAVDWAVGALLLVRREAWDAAGGFDPRQWMYAEDLDLGWRASRAGWFTYFEPRAVVHHRESAATSQVWGQGRDERWIASTYAWMLRRRGWLITRTVALANIVGAGARALALTAPARAAPDRWEWRRRFFLRWMRLHAVGLADRRRLLEHQ